MCIRDRRQFMRVDWSDNQAAMPEGADPMAPFYVSRKLGTTVAVTEADNPLINPDRPIVQRDYIDFTLKETRSPDLLACYKLFGADDEVGPWGCGDAQLTICLLYTSPSPRD